MNPRPECPLVQERLVPLLEGELPRGEAELVRAHLDGCAACAEESATWATLRDDVRRARPSSHGLRAAMLGLAAGLDRERHALPARRFVAAAAAVLLGTLALVRVDPPAATWRGVEVASRALRSRIERIERTLPPLSFDTITLVQPIGEDR